MSTSFQLHLLRRTLAVLSVALGFCSGVQAQGTVTLTGANGNSCSYSTLSITPNGNVTVTCAGGTVDPVDHTIPGTFRVSQATMQANANSTVSVTVSRRAGDLATTIWWWRGGDGCIPTSGGLSFSAGQMSNSIATPMLGSGTCQVSLAVAPPAVLEEPSSTTITVGGSTGNPTIPVAGCPTGFVQPEELVTASLGGQGNLMTQYLKSGQIVSMALPAVTGAWNSGTITMSEIASSPQPVTIEMSVNPCPGLIEPATSDNACNLRSQFGHNNKVQWLAKPYQGYDENTPPANLYPFGLCWAGTSGKQYYLNVRWTFPVCQWGVAACGYNFQYNPGPY